MTNINTYSPADLMSAVAEQQLAETRLTETPLLGLMAGRAQLTRQRPIEWAARLTDAASGGRALAGSLADDTAGSLGEAALTVPDFYFKYQMNVRRRDLIEAAATGKIQAVRSAVGTEIADALRSLTQTINGVLYTGTGVANTTHFGVLGLNTIAAQTGTYAGISRTTYPRWKCILQQGGTPGTPEALTVDRVTALLRARRIAGATSLRNNGTNLIILTSDEIENDVLRKLYQAETQSQADYSRMVANIEPYAGYAVKGIPVVSDVVAATANKMRFIDPSKMDMYVFDEEGAPGTIDTKISFFGYQGLKFRMADVSDNHPDIFKAEMSISLQLKCHDPIQGLTILDDVAHAAA
ncbi:hypothetical protein IQ273_12840 [Nodosilinea sp. LEGE 07298]|uniref:hypothetical protein n=1 Tax=Nodosilinea sp. LEGE 07298 TaxID=2777970 RepID=UPI00187E90EF|nr:hypothetical protein [Nodosilinea sp. LEGE 07298]MBE9110299.1 hypothetical protein [Nodosilinea sp. LEGE 07298]